MKTHRLLFTLLACGILAGTLAYAMDAPRGSLSAQSRPFDSQVLKARTCGTPEPAALEAQQLHEAVQRYVETMGVEAIQAVGGQIQVAFHVIYYSTEGNVPQEQIDAQIAEMNKCYAGYYGGVNTGYTFVLASVDRTSNKKWFTMLPGSNNERLAKQTLALDVPHRLNVYTCKPGRSLLGWSYFPTSYAESSYMHGVVFHYGSLPGGYLTPYNLGGTLVHESGHYMGLYHTFQGGCTAPGDYVDDTPYEGTSTAGCPEGKDTCTELEGLDPIHNFMDYSDDACYLEFTALQDARMDAIIPVYRPNLLNAALAQSVEPAQEVPGAVAAGGIQLRGAFPNPFRGETVLRYALPREERVSLKVYNVTGQLVRTLVDGTQAAGERFEVFDGDGLPAGLYFAALRAGGAVTTRTMILLK
jgi:hypothetical protein